MAANINPEALKRFIPFDTMTDAQRIVAVEHGSLIRVAEGKMLFKRRENDAFSYWLLRGSVDLLDDKFNIRPARSGTAPSRFPLDNNTPHQVSAVCTAESIFLKLERAVVDRLVNEEVEDPYSVSGLGDDEEEVDWMSILLSSPLFEFVPPANIQRLFSKFEEVAFDAGEQVIAQGDPGDYFYVITAGNAKVEQTVDGRTHVRAELEPGAFFGEDALISDVPRNATITMLTPGKLMRISEFDFEQLLQKPLMEVVSLDEALEMTVAGDPKTYILDVRNQDEISAGGEIEGSINVPLLELRKNLAELSKDAVYITRCDGGKRCELAAYILNQSGYTAYVMKKPRSS